MIVNGLFIKWILDTLPTIIVILQVYKKMLIMFNMKQNAPLSIVAHFDSNSVTPMHRKLHMR